VQANARSSDAARQRAAHPSHGPGRLWRGPGGRSALTPAFGVGCRIRSVAPKRLGAKLRSGRLLLLSGSGGELSRCCGEAICPEQQLPQAVSKFGKVRNPRKAGSLERGKPLPLHEKTLEPRPEVET
jgi:hypothetical protein